MTQKYMGDENCRLAWFKPLLKAAQLPPPPKTRDPRKKPPLTVKRFLYFFSKKNTKKHFFLKVPKTPISQQNNTKPAPSTTHPQRFGDFQSPPEALRVEHQADLHARLGVEGGHRGGRGWGSPGGLWRRQGGGRVGACCGQGLAWGRLREGKDHTCIAGTTK